MLQQYLPFTVLKLGKSKILIPPISAVATVLAVYGIETLILPSNIELAIKLQQRLPFTVLKLEIGYIK